MNPIRDIKEINDNIDSLTQQNDQMKRSLQYYKQSTKSIKSSKSLYHRKFGNMVDKYIEFCGSFKNELTNFQHELLNEINVIKEEEQRKAMTFQHDFLNGSQNNSNNPNINNTLTINNPQSNNANDNNEITDQNAMNVINKTTPHTTPLSREKQPNKAQVITNSNQNINNNNKEIQVTSPQVITNVQSPTTTTTSMNTNNDNNNNNNNNNPMIASPNSQRKNAQTNNSNIASNVGGVNRSIGSPSQPRTSPQRNSRNPRNNNANMYGQSNRLPEPAVFPAVEVRSLAEIMADDEKDMKRQRDRNNKEKSSYANPSYAKKKKRRGGKKHKTTNSSNNSGKSNKNKKQVIEEVYKRDRSGDTYHYLGDAWIDWYTENIKKDKNNVGVHCSTAISIENLPKGITDSRIRRFLFKVGGIPTKCIMNVRVQRGNFAVCNVKMPYNVLENIVVNKLNGAEYGAVVTKKKSKFGDDGFGGSGPGIGERAKYAVSIFKPNYTARFNDILNNKEPSLKLHVSGFSIFNDQCHREVTDVFLDFGDLRRDIKIGLDGRKEPYAIVTFWNINDAIVTCTNPVYYQNRILKIRYFQTKGNRM